MIEAGNRIVADLSGQGLRGAHVHEIFQTRKILGIWPAKKLIEVHVRVPFMHGNRDNLYVAGQKSQAHLSDNEKLQRMMANRLEESRTYYQGMKWNVGVEKWEDDAGKQIGYYAFIRTQKA